MREPPISTDLLARLDRLERENKRNRLLAVLSFLLLVAWTACSVAPRAENVVTAQRFVLSAPDGTEQGALELDPQGTPMLVLEKGEARAILSLAGPGFLLRGPDGKTGAFLGIDSRNVSRLELTSERLVDGVRVTARPDGSSGLYVLDTNGRERCSLESLSNGSASLQVRDALGRPRGQLGIDPGEQPNLILLDAAAGRRMGMAVLEDGTPLLEMADAKGRPRAQLTAEFDGSPRLSLLREDGGKSFQAP